LCCFVRTPFRTMWNAAAFRVCADGGANRIYDHFGLAGLGDVASPKAICGDLDSLRDKVRLYFVARGTAVHHDPGQDSNDMEKCLKLVKSECPALQHVVAYGGLSGRLDQVFAVLNGAHAFAHQDEAAKLWIVDHQSITFVVKAGHNVVHFSPRWVGHLCGIVPLATESAVVTTQGLRWDLTAQETRFGGLVSSSNVLEAATLTIRTSKPLLWTITLDE